MGEGEISCEGLWGMRKCEKFGEEEREVELCEVFGCTREREGEEGGGEGGLRNWDIFGDEDREAKLWGPREGEGEEDGEGVEEGLRNWEIFGVTETRAGRRGSRGV